MQSRTVARELALLMLGQVSDRGSAGAADLALDALLQQALATLSQHVREALDQAATDLQEAQQQLLDSELQDQGSAEQLPRVRQHLQDGLAHAEQGLNRLSASLELPRLLMLADQEEVRRGAVDRTQAVLRCRADLDQRLDALGLVSALPAPPPEAALAAAEPDEADKPKRGRRADLIEA